MAGNGQMKDDEEDEKIFYYLKKLGTQKGQKMHVELPKRPLLLVRKFPLHSSHSNPLKLRFCKEFNSWACINELHCLHV